MKYNYHKFKIKINKLNKICKKLKSKIKIVTISFKIKSMFLYIKVKKYIEIKESWTHE